MWLFAYGSLMWRPGFAYQRAEPARLSGWVRRFWQGSTDHRGTEISPGRVVTLIADPVRDCVGIAYKIQADGLPHTMNALDFREKGGYLREELPVTLPSGRQVSALTYIALPENRHFLGPDQLHRMACQIIHARGPSGPNLTYLESLADILIRMGATDVHVSALMASVRAQLRA
jgi:cation transport regulator ChaC